MHHHLSSLSSKIKILVLFYNNQKYIFMSCELLVQLVLREILGVLVEGFKHIFNLTKNYDLLHALLKVTNILFSSCTNIHRNLLMCSSD